jgi:hypothetical protein
MSATTIIDSAPLGALIRYTCQSALKSAPLSASKRDPSGDVVSRPVAA